MKKIVIGCVILLILGLIIGGIVAWWGYSKVKDQMAMDPAKVEAMASEIMTWQMPDGSSGVGVFGMDLGFKMAVVANTGEHATLTLILMKMPAAWSHNPEQEAQRALNNMDNNQHNTIESMHRKTGTLDGNDVEIVIQEGTSRRTSSNVPFIMYQTSCVHDGSIVFVMVQGYGEGMEEQVEELFASLRFAE